LSHSAILLLLALTTSTAFLPNHAYYSPLFVFAAGAVGFGGCTALITGFVWGRWEDRTLRRVEEEIREEVGKLLARQRKGSVGGGA
jgi:sphingomyelin phosphodiesterase 2